MLVLSRKVGEKLVIDGNITVEVVRIQGNRITLGLVAPADVKILRGELNPRMKPSKKLDESNPALMALLQAEVVPVFRAHSGLRMNGQGDLQDERKEHAADIECTTAVHGSIQGGCNSDASGCTFCSISS